MCISAFPCFKDDVYHIAVLDSWSVMQGEGLLHAAGSWLGGESCKDGVLGARIQRRRCPLLPAVHAGGVMVVSWHGVEDMTPLIAGQLRTGLRAPTSAQFAIAAGVSLSSGVRVPGAAHHPLQILHRPALCRYERGAQL